MRACLTLADGAFVYLVSVTGEVRTVLGGWETSWLLLLASIVLVEEPSWPMCSSNERLQRHRRRRRSAASLSADLHLPLLPPHMLLNGRSDDCVCLQEREGAFRLMCNN